LNFSATVNSLFVEKEHCKGEMLQEARTFRRGSNFFWGSSLACGNFMIGPSTHNDRQTKVRGNRGKVEEEKCGSKAAQLEDVEPANQETRSYHHIGGKSYQNGTKNFVRVCLDCKNSISRARFLSERVVHKWNN
jgi:hypothetical protein